MTLRGRVALEAGGTYVAAWPLETGAVSRLLPALDSRFSLLAAACTARKDTIWRQYLPLEGVWRPPRGPQVSVGDLKTPKIES